MFQELFRGKTVLHDWGQCSNLSGVFSPVIAVSLLIRQKTSYQAVSSLRVLFTTFFQQSLSTYRHSFLHLLYHNRFKPNQNKTRWEKLYSNHCLTAQNVYCTATFFTHTHSVLVYGGGLSTTSESVRNPNATVSSPPFHILPYRYQRRKMWLGLGTAVTTSKWTNSQ